jgi:hypothetical protein
MNNQKRLKKQNKIKTKVQKKNKNNKITEMDYEEPI